MLNGPLITCTAYSLAGSTTKLMSRKNSHDPILKE